MPRAVTILDILLSSPSDVSPERIAVMQTAREWNSLRSKQSGYFLNILTWESVAPSLADYPQEVINSQIGDDFDVFLGVMWGRFGTPTASAPSGTIEEFDRALDRYRGGGAVRLAMLFKTQDIPLSNLDGQQYDLVKSFKLRYSQEGGLYREFATEDQLRMILNHLFEQIVLSPLPSNALAKLPVRVEMNIQDQTRIPEPDDAGLFEVNDRIQAIVDVQSKFFTDYTALSQISTAKIGEASNEMDTLVRLGHKDSPKIRKCVSRVSAAMDEVSDFLRDRFPDYVIKNIELAEVTESALDVVGDFGEGDAKPEMRVAIEGVIETLEANLQAINGLVMTVQGLPRLSAEFNRAKKRYVSAQSELSDDTRKLRDALLATLALY